MGIQSLLPFLANSTRDAHINEFENEYVAVDAYCWLHKGVYSCAYELAMKKPTTKYVDYCMRYIEMLEHFQVKPILVFDGRRLSSKSETEKKRREERKKKYEKGKELLRAGKTFEGRKLLGESVDISHEIALNLIKRCHERNIDCIVAPYEADSQLAFFSLRNIVKCIITEDSDLLAYGCERVMFKMNTCGRGKLIEKSQIHFSLNMTPEDFSEDNFRYMCILSGCDYLPSLPSIGPANALKFVKQLKDVNIYDALPKLPIYLNKMNVKVTPEYIAGFKVADNTFKHQLVYDPFKRAQVPLQPTNNDNDIVGMKLPDDEAFDLALGNIDPISMKTLHNYKPDFCKGHSMLWKLEIPEPKQMISNSYQEFIEGKKRQREIMESDEVHVMKKDLKKQRFPFSVNDTFPAKKAEQNAHKTGFIFEPKASEANKDLSKPSKLELLKSRYFHKDKSKKEEKKQAVVTKDRQKGEGYEDYLQRLYNEWFPVGEEENGKPEDCCCKEFAGKRLSPDQCSSCEKCNSCCRCSSGSHSSAKKSNENISKRVEEKTEKEKPVEHSIFDEFSKSEIKNSENESRDDTRQTGGKSSEKSFSESLSSPFSKFLLKLDSKHCSTVGNCKTELPEKENSEVIYEGEYGAVRSPSPVFKLQKDARVLKRNCTLGNISDTAGTPTSVYFSSGDTESSKEFDSVSKRTPSSFKRTMPSVKSFSSVPSKAGRNNMKNSSASRTLFQFGFKKERRSDP